ncbi:MAG TPA: radical SAM protein, partial [Spirochaetia bacterium]
MRVLLVQPPFVQLNAPYPAIAYLAAFCRREGHDARCLDLAIALFHRIFSAAGLETVFAEAERRRAELLPGSDAATRANVLRYLSNADRYVRDIDRIVRLLCVGDEPFANELAAARRVPWGHRAEGFLEANDGEIGASDAPLLASLVIEDLADFI